MNVNILSNKATHFFVLFCIIIGCCVSCNTTKYVPDGQHLLTNVKIKSSPTVIKRNEFKDYVKQNPNYKVFDTWNMRLGIYSLSGTDSTKWINRLLKNVGSPPVIYNERLAENTAKEFRQFFFNRGYMDAEVGFDPAFNKKRATVTYYIKPNEPYTIAQLVYDIQDTEIERIVLNDTVNSRVKPGMLFNGDTFNEERNRIANNLRQRGYYLFTKDNIHYLADSSHVSKQVDLRMQIRDIPFTFQVTDTLKAMDFKQRIFDVNDVYLLVDNVSPTTRSRHTAIDTLMHDGYHIVQRQATYKPSFLTQKCFIKPHSRYSEDDLYATYNALGSLRAFQYANIRFDVVDSTKVDCFISLTSGKSQSVSVSLEGTNSAGDLGVAGSINYQHRNSFKGSEIFNIRLRGAYEALSGSISDLWNNNYKEVGVETSVLFPKFHFPFLDKEFKNKLRPSTEYGTSFGWQERPEYERFILSGSWKYNWSVQNGRNRHSINPVFFDYVHIPRLSDKFEKDLDRYPALRYSFDDHVIAGSSYSFHATNLGQKSNQHKLYSLRAAVETSGNLVYALSTLSNANKNSKGQYTLVNVPISQYVKGDFDFSRTHIVDDDNSFAYHLGIGMAYPYKNAAIMPFEKRYYAGGANSVRGWSVRTLGPGSYRSTGQVIDYANQSGDIRLDMSVEWRTKIFWMFQLAGYVDAGNVWTIKDYESQPGGLFEFNKFYKEIAMSYGLGLRLDFNYFLIRLDSGMKAYDPAYPTDPWVLLKPKFSRDFAIHFAIGYPF